MVAEVRITLPYPTPSANAWAGRRGKGARWVYADWKKKLVRDVAVVAVAHRVPHADGPRSVTITRYGARLLDYDNLVGGCKPLVDALQAARLIVNDGPSMVRVEYRQETDRGHQRTEIEFDSIARAGAREGSAMI